MKSAFRSSSPQNHLQHLRAVKLEKIAKAEKTIPQKQRSASTCIVKRKYSTLVPELDSPREDMLVNAYKKSSV